MRRDQTKHKKIYTYTAIFEPAEEGGYAVTVPALPGCVTQGETFEEAKGMAQDAIKLYLKVLQKDGEEIPREKEDRFEVRIPIAAPA